MFISPTNNTAFYGGNIKLIGFKADDLSENFRQIFDLAKRKQIDFSILKRDGLQSNVDAYSIIASKEINHAPWKLQGITVSQVYRNSSKDNITIKILSSVLEAIDLINEKLTKTLKK